MCAGTVCSGSLTSGAVGRSRSRCTGTRRMKAGAGGRSSARQSARLGPAASIGQSPVGRRRQCEPTGDAGRFEHGEPDRRHEQAESEFGAADVSQVGTGRGREVEVKRTQQHRAVTLVLFVEVVDDGQLRERGRPVPHRLDRRGRSPPQAPDSMPSAHSSIGVARWVQPSSRPLIVDRIPWRSVDTRQKIPTTGTKGVLRSVDRVEPVRAARVRAPAPIAAATVGRRRESRTHSRRRAPRVATATR